MTTDADRLRVMAALRAEACAGFGPSAWRTMAEHTLAEYRESRARIAATVPGQDAIMFVEHNQKGSA